MITGNYWDLQDDRSVRMIDQAAVRLLSESGVRVENDLLLGELESAGCRVERSAMRCFLPETLIRKVLAHFGGKDDATVEMPTGWNPQRRLIHLGGYPHLLEWPSGQRRLATRQDVLDMARMAHELEEFGAVGRVLVCSEVDPRIEALWTALQIAQTTDKKLLGGEILLAEQIEPLVRMGEVISGKKDDTTLLCGCDFFIAPLIFESRQAECFLAKRRYGLTIQPGTMPISGLSAPVTIAGTVAIAVAELIAGWVLGYVTRPDLRADGIVCSGSLDMRSATPCFGSPEALLQDAMTVQVCRRLYGMHVFAATGYVDCKHPGLQATFQKMFPLIAAPLGMGGIDCGLLSAGQDYSPVQHLLDAEVNTAIDRFRGTFEVSDETIALEAIQEQIGSGSANFVDLEHTLNHYRAEQWYPKWFDRQTWQDEDTERGSELKMLQRIDDYCKDAIRRYQPPDVDKEMISELRGVFLSAEKDILGSNTTGV